VAQGRTVLFRILVLVALGLSWEAVVRLFNIAPYLLPTPSAVIAEIILHPGLYWANFLATLAGTVAGFAIAAVLGLMIGVILVYSQRLRAILYPAIIVAQTTPKIAIAPLLVVWLGYGFLPKLVMVVAVAFFPVVMSTVVGLSAVERDLLDLVRMLKGSALQQFTKVAFPQAMPSILAGLKVAVTLAVIGQIVAEFVAGNVGLGNMIVLANSQLNVAMSFAAILLLCGMGLGLFDLIGLAERLIVPWSIEDSDELFASP
jgi:NitT/TauT family transport system permease protein